MRSNDKDRSRFPAAVLWLSVAWVAIAIGATTWGLPNEENDLTERATIAISGSGLTIEFEGRDATIAGTTSDQTTLDWAIATIRDLRGVRSVDAVNAVAAPLATPQVASPPPTTTTTAPSVTPTDLAPAAPQFSAHYERPTIELTGTLSDGDTVDAIVAAAGALYGAANVVNNLTTDESVNATQDMARLPEIFELVGRLNPWTLTVDQGHIALGGLGGDQANLDRIVASFEGFAEGFEGFESTVEIHPNAVAATVTDIRAGGANFETGSAELSVDAISRLDAAVEVLLANPSARLRAEGHTDNVGSAEANLVLSAERAQAVVDYLVAGGVEPDRLVAIGHGEQRPLASNRTAEGRAVNRRIEFTVRNREVS
jgi:OOP family OmpA-OmpF porin